MQEKRVKVNQIELQVREYEQEGEPIIFLHFSGANLMMWQRAIPYFQNQFHIFLVDLRGHGKSDQPATGYHMDDMASDVIEMMRQLNLEKAHIIGTSMGAEVGLSLAANHPESVLSLVCDGALSSEFGPFSTWEGTQAAYDEHVSQQLEKMRGRPETDYPSVDALVEASQKILDDWWNPYVEAVERYGAFIIEEGKVTKAFQKRARIDYMENYFQYRLEDYYRKVVCPFLMISEVVENEREKTVMEALRKLARQATIVEVKDWIHPYGWMLNPDTMCQTILKFLGDTTSRIK